jgi:hypothetical protein
VQFWWDDMQVRVVNEWVKRCPECQVAHVTRNWSEGVEEIWGKMIRGKLAKEGVVVSKWDVGCNEGCKTKVAAKGALLHKVIGA